MAEQDDFQMKSSQLAIFPLDITELSDPICLKVFAYLYIVYWDLIDRTYPLFIPETKCTVLCALQFENVKYAFLRKDYVWKFFPEACGHDIRSTETMPVQKVLCTWSLVQVGYEPKTNIPRSTFSCNYRPHFDQGWVQAVPLYRPRYQTSAVYWTARCSANLQRIRNTETSPKSSGPHRQRYVCTCCIRPDPTPAWLEGTLWLGHCVCVLVCNHLYPET